MPRKKTEAEKPGKKTKRDFLSLIAANFTAKTFGSLISRAGLPRDDTRGLCDSFRDLKE